LLVGDFYFPLIFLSKLFWLTCINHKIIIAPFPFNRNGVKTHQGQFVSAFKRGAQAIGNPREFGPPNLRFKELLRAG
jgi:hypothetical protein